MKPNRFVLAYLAVFAAALIFTAFLASLAAALHTLGWITGRLLWTPDRWLATATILALGVLPWPGLIAVGAALLAVRDPNEFRVERKTVGLAAVALIALDEEGAVGDVVRDFQAEPRVDRVIVVDNGSSDRTEEFAARAGALVVHEDRRGYGHCCVRALAEGLRSGQDVVILCEADRTFTASDVQNLTGYLQYSDLVVGSRTHQILLNSDSQLTSFLALGNTFVAKLLQLRYWHWKDGPQVRLTDVGCTYRAIRAEALRRILPSLEVGGHHFAPHMTMVALEHGLRVIEVPVSFWKRVGVSKGGNANWRKGLALGVVMIWHILTYRVRHAMRTPSSSTETASHATLQ